MYEAVHLFATAAHFVADATPAPTPSGDGGYNFAGLAALVASLAGLVSAIGAIVIGLRRRGDSSEASDKAIEYLIRQNRDLLRDQKDRP